MPLYVGDSGALCTQDDILHAGECVCRRVIPGVWCACNEGDQPDYTVVIPEGSIADPVVSNPDGNCWEFDPANARPQEEGDLLSELGGVFPECEDCCGAMVVPGVWCACNDGDPPGGNYTPVIEAPCIGAFVTKVGDNCWSFNCADERSFQSGDSYVSIAGGWETCADCCDAPDPDPQPTCCTGNAGLCYPLTSPMAIVSSNVTHRQTIICDGGGTWADYTEIIPFAGVFPMIQADPPVPCGNSQATALVTPNVPYPYTGFCVNPGVSNLPLGYGFSANQSNGSPPNTVWDVRIDLYGAGVTTTIPNIQIVGGIVSPPPFVQIGRQTSFGLSLSLNFTASVGLSVSGRCGPQLTIQWNGSRTWDFGVYAITLQSIGSIVVRFTGYGQCGPDARASVPRRRGCTNCGNDNREGLIL